MFLSNCAPTQFVRQSGSITCNGTLYQLNLLRTHTQTPQSPNDWCHVHESADAWQLRSARFDLPCSLCVQCRSAARHRHASRDSKNAVAHSNTDSLSSSEEKGVASMGRAARKPRWSPVNITCSHKRSNVQRLAMQRSWALPDICRQTTHTTHQFLHELSLPTSECQTMLRTFHFTPCTVLDESLAHD